MCFSKFTDQNGISPKCDNCNGIDPKKTLDKNAGVLAQFRLKKCTQMLTKSINLYVCNKACMAQWGQIDCQFSKWVKNAGAK